MEKNELESFAEDEKSQAKFERTRNFLEILRFEVGKFRCSW